MLTALVQFANVKIGLYLFILNIAFAENKMTPTFFVLLHQWPII